jgi:hypothetical protein
MSRRLDPVGSKKCPECNEIKPLEGFSIKVRQPDGSTKYEGLDCFKIKGKRPDGSIRYEAKCNSCRNKGGGLLWLPRSKTHKTCRQCGQLKPRSRFKTKERNAAGDAVNWLATCIDCQQKKTRFPHLYRTKTHKACRECGGVKLLSEFGRKGKTSRGTPLYSARCKSCIRQRSKTPEARKRVSDYYERNRERVKSAARASYQRHKGKRVAQKAIYREKNRERIRQWFKQKYAEDPEHWAKVRRMNRESYERHAEKRRKYRREYVRKFVDKVRESARKAREKRYLSGKSQVAQREYFEKNRDKLCAYVRDRRRTNINANIASKLRIRMNSVLRYNKKSKATEQLLGCSVSEFAVRFQSQFEEGMTWEKFLAGEIHIDHIVPCALFDLSLPDEQAECFHFSNLQPLWATDNLRKPKYVDPKGKRRKRES